MRKTKFRSLGIGFLISAILLVLVTFIWPFVPQSLKSQLSALNLPIVSEGTANAELQSSYDSLVAESSSAAESYKAALASHSSAATSNSSTASSSTPAATGPVEFTISEGETSTSVAERLHAAGLVDDAAAFESFLETNGYVPNIWVGTFELRPGMTYQEIAAIIAPNT